MSSVIAVNNISDPIVLRRILQTIAQRLDTIEGISEDPERTAAWREADRRVASVLNEQINELRLSISELNDELGGIAALAQTVAYATSRVALMNLDWTSPTAVTLTKAYNVSGATRIATGVWEFTLVQDTVYGAAVLANSAPTISWVIAPSSWNYNVEFSVVSSTKFRLRFAHGGSDRDLAAGDKVYFTLQFVLPTAGLPPA
jgi:hypothetical protein